MKIMIKCKSIGKVKAVLSDENPKTAKEFYDALPLSGRTYVWGEEIYFPLPVKEIKAENSREVVKKGEIAIWIENPSFCIFFGKTPVSKEKEIRAYSAVNVIGKISGNPDIFQKVRRNEEITVSRVEAEPDLIE